VAVGALVNFDSVAGSYRILENLAFGRYLEHCRTLLLPLLVPEPRKALFIGEGDGRFLQRFAQRFPKTRVDVVESSARMIELAKRRAEQFPHARFYCEDILDGDWQGGEYDLVVTHFFLDVLSEGQLQSLVFRMKRAAQNGYWLVSEFRQVSQPVWARWPSRFLIGVMYMFFRVTTGLRTRTIPDYEQVFIGAGMQLCARKLTLGGFLVSELWRLPSGTNKTSPGFHRGSLDIG
jgi:ubiquinone/menaquinone biosynthesis C-methylase UbiE